jgi:hypothetical protein
MQMCVEHLHVHINKQVSLTDARDADIPPHNSGVPSQAAASQFYCPALSP